MISRRTKFLVLISISGLSLSLVRVYLFYRSYLPLYRAGLNVDVSLSLLWKGIMLISSMMFVGAAISGLLDIYGRTRVIRRAEDHEAAN